MSKYKCVKGCYYRDRLWDIGEVINSETAPNKHFKVINEKKELDREAKIKHVLEGLDSRNKDLWSRAGLPKVDEVSKLLGFQVTKKDIDEVVPGFKRDTNIAKTQNVNSLL